MIRKFHKKQEAREHSPAWFFEVNISGKRWGRVEYDPYPILRDTEQVPLLEESGIDPFLPRARYVSIAFCNRSPNRYFTCDGLPTLRCAL